MNGRARTTLVTGATGFLGSSLVRRLLADGVHLRVLTRTPQQTSTLSRLGAEVVIGDITDRHAVSAAVAGAEVIYHLAGRLLVPGVPPSEYRRTHVDGTRLLLDCCASLSALRRFVHCSTTGVLGATGDSPADEAAPVRPTNVYEATKAEAEQAVRELWRNDFPAVIARPGLVYGPGDLHLLPFFRAVLQRRFRPIGHQQVWLHPIYIDDMTDALVRCAERGAAVGECFNLAGQHPVALTELAAAIAEAVGVCLPRGYIPLAVAKGVAAFGDRLPADRRQSAPLTTDRLAFLTHSRVYDVSKARRLLGFAAATDLRSGAAATTAWYQQRGFLRPAAA